MTLKKVKKNREFRKIYNLGRSVANKYLVLYYKNNDLSENRVGISISKKVGNAVVRNRIRRRLTEIYRLNMDRFKIGFDLIIIVRPRFIKQAGFKELEAAFLHLIKKVNLIKEEDKV